MSTIEFLELFEKTGVDFTKATESTTILYGLDQLLDDFNKHGTDLKYAYKFDKRVYL